MAKKVVGYVKLEWKCPNCQTRNPGDVKVCVSCGAAQPADVDFVQPATTEVIKDEATIEKAKAAPDIHCGYCGARNPANTQVCTNCGANLAEGKQRAAGQVVGAFRNDPVPDVTCAACGEKNPPANARCSRCGAPLPGHEPQPASPPQPVTGRKISPIIWVLGGVGLIVVVCIILSLFRSNSMTGTVADRSWRSVVALEQFGPVEKQDWRDELPAGAKLISCEERYRETVQDSVPGAVEVCGTPYTVDEGTGFGKVVQDCAYEVYADYCRYQVEEWAVVQDLVEQGSNSSPVWPSYQTSENQRLGDRSQSFTIVFEVEGKTKSLTTTDESLFNQAVIGSIWNLSINGFGDIVTIEPTQ